MTTTWQEGLRQQQPQLADEHATVSDIAAELNSSGLPTAPHIVARLFHELDGDRAAVHEVAAALTAAQRSGQRMLPTLLPLVPSVEALSVGIDPGDEDRLTLLTAALSIDDDLEPLLIAASRSAEDLLRPGIAEHLRASNGRFALTRRRTAIWLQHAATPQETACAHRKLERAHRVRGDEAIAAWHAARGAVERRPEIASPLTNAAGELRDRGETDRAFAFAIEASEHAAPLWREHAHLIAGTTAASAGCFDDANDLLADLASSSNHAVRAGSLTALLIAQTCGRGTIPTLDTEARPPRAGDPRLWRAWARTTGLAAVLCAERGATSAMRSWLAEAREADTTAGAGGEVRDPAVALCWMLTGEADADPIEASGTFSGALLDALRSAMDGDVVEGRQGLARSALSVPEDDPLIPGFERSPLTGAYLAVTEALLRFWSGDIEDARACLAAAALRLPVGIPFAGLGAVLARRIDIAIDGASGPVARAISATLPDGIRIDTLVDSGLSAYLLGESEQAATDIALWRDRGAPEPPLALAGLEEVGPFVDRERVEPPDASAARSLLQRIRGLTESSWRHEHREIAEAGRTLTSSFERGRVEALLGSTSLVHGDLPGGRRHLRAARRLFEDAGAHAWKDAMDARIAGVRTTQDAMSDPMTDPIAVIRDDDALAAGRAAWETLLTQRELEVAMRVAAGSENREIATALDVSVRTVEVHVRHLFDKLGARNRVELAVMAHRAGRVF
ncbi:helix-turn-helix domain-containing protein [Microbacterium tenebrionis]|uniref:helix-turn-helix domain-containing protein n=1 Tax=Microbacterium tenebrionis TaxID=2830665 RepID=UPI00158BC648|nr:helix-turn-helix transcriptional regulator [Microbacterium ihumii]